MSVPITPKQTLTSQKHHSQFQYLLELQREIRSHITLQGWDIKQVILLLGNTVVSPKEQYVIDISSFNSTTQCSARTEHAKFVLKIMQTLFIDPFLDSLPATLPFTNCFLMLNVDKTTVLKSPSKFFEPKLRFSIPKRGLRYTLNLSNNEAESCVDSDSVYMAAPRPFKNSAATLARKQPRDFLDTIE